MEIVIYCRGGAKAISIGVLLGAEGAGTVDKGVGTVDAGT